ncbi:MAG: oligosaccharide flippase family protein [Verrucomicrobiota bacterium]|nr:oligosaccharide flippase family protein [Verrucomicrobiota bacterium]
MSRLKNFSRNLTASYLQLAANVAYSLLSVPLILHWLPRAEFGLWAVLVQLMSYLTLVDLGVNQAISRFLIDHKDERGTGGYGSLIKTSVWVSAVQGLIVLAIVTFGSPALADAMKIPAQYQALFIFLMRIQGLIAALTFCANPLTIILYAHQRMDIVTWRNIFGLVAGLILLVLFLFMGCGIYSFVYANGIIAVIVPLYLLWNCRQLGFLPKKGEWGKMSWRQFQEVFLYGKDVFLMNVGAQLITASQTIIISRALGLELAAAWTVGTRVFTFVRLSMFQPYAAASPGLCEMVARNEMERLQYRFRNLVSLIASLGVFLGTMFVLCNGLFVRIWTSGKIIWPPENDVLLGLWIFFTALQAPHCNFVAVTKQIGGMRYLYFVEGCSFVLLSLLLGYRWGIPGIVGSSVLCLVFFSYQFGLRRSQKYFRVSFLELTVGWIKPSLKLAAALVPAAIVIWFATSGLPVLWRLMVNGAAAGLIGGLLFLRLGVPPEMIREAGGRLPRPAARLLGMLAPCHT